MSFIIAATALAELLFESLVLLNWIIQLAKGIAQLEAAGKEFETLNVRWIIRLCFRQRRDLNRIVVDDRGLDQERLNDSLKQVVD